MRNFIRRYFIHLLLSIASAFVVKQVMDTSKQTPESILIEFEVSVKSGDSFQLFYTSPSSDFMEEQSARVNATGQEGRQQLRYIVPLTGNIGKIRLDLGDYLPEGLTTESIEFISCTLSNKEKDFVIRRDSSRAYFAPSGSVEWVENGSVLATHPDANGVYDPYIVSSAKIIKAFSDLSEPVYQLPVPYFIGIVFWLTLVFFIFHFLPPIDSISAFGKLSFVIVFVAILCIPVLVQLKYGENTESLEKRALAPRPEFAITKQFARDFETYYNDNFGLRSKLITLGSILKIRAFHASMNPKSAIMGKNNFIFYNNSGGEDGIFRSYTRRNLYTIEQLQNYAETLDSHTQWLKDKGIVAIWGVWPNKSTIYPENLPFAMKMQILDTLSLTDQVTSYLASNRPNIKFIDIRNELVLAKDEKQLYYSFDTHWNDYGAYIGYRTLMEKSYDLIKVKPFQLDDFTISADTIHDGDLLQLAGAGSDFAPSEIVPRLRIKNSELSYSVSEVPGFSSGSITTICQQCPDQRSVLVFGDSFLGAFAPYLSRHFNKVTYLRTGFQRPLVEMFNPNIVIQMRVERYLKHSGFSPFH
jgi:hypothetical protein